MNVFTAKHFMWVIRNVTDLEIFSVIIHKHEKLQLHCNFIHL